MAASADGDKRNNYGYEHEPKDYECHLAKPWRYKCVNMAPCTALLSLLPTQHTQSGSTI